MHQAHAEAGRLMLLFDGEPAARRDICWVMPGRRHQPATVRAFIDAMTTTLASSSPKSL